MGAILSWLNGKKTTIGAIITVVSSLVATAGVVLPVLGIDAVHAAQWVGYGVTIVGLLHKAYKAIYNEDHP
jgi:hypothetical protein